MKLLKNMKLNKINKNLLAISLTAIISISLGVWYVAARAAGTGSFSLSAATGSYVNGSNFTVIVKENGSDQINTVNAELNYDASKIQFVSIDTSNSTFDYPLSATGGNGNVTIARGVSNGGTVTGSQTVASVTFKVLANSGSSAITFGSSTAIVRPSDGANVWNGSTAGGSYTFTAPPPPPTTPPTAPPTTPPTTTTKPGATATPNPGSTTKTPTPTPNSSSSNTPSNPSSPTAETQNANPEAPIQVSKSNESVTGYMVAIKCVDKNGKLLTDANVTLDSKTVKCDQTGIASFINISPGKHDVEVESNGNKIKSTIDVAEGKNLSEVQQFDAGFKDDSWILWVSLAGGVLLMVLIGGGIYMMRKRRGGSPKPPNSAKPLSDSSKTNTPHSKEDKTPAPKTEASSLFTPVQPSITQPTEKPIESNIPKDDTPKSNVPDSPNSKSTPDLSPPK